jgi:dTDP-glucose pyrophosphorylase
MLFYITSGFNVFMKAVIFAGGKGTRMLPLTKETNKVLIPVNGKPFLWYVIDAVRKVGVKDIGIIVNYKKEKIADFLREYGIEATLIDQDEPKGTGHALLCSAAFVGKEPFLVCPGDNLVSVDDLRNVIWNTCAPRILGLHHPQPQNYGVLQVDGKKLVSIVEKPKEPVSDLINTGVYFFTNDIFDHLKNVPRQQNGEYYLTDALTSLAMARKVEVVPIKGFWLDLSRPEDLPKVEEALKKNIEA